jgi:hypothetical protein
MWQKLNEAQIEAEKNMSYICERAIVLVSMLLSANCEKDIPKLY